MNTRQVMNRARRRLRALLFRSSFEREMTEEMRFHLELEIEERIRQGMMPAEARRTALRDFGGVERFKEEGRAARGLRAWDELVQDLRFGVRLLARRPGFAVVAMLTLAVGIGATTAVFGLANAVLFRPIPGVQGGDRLVQVRFRAPNLGDREAGISYPNLMDLRAAELPAVADLVGWQGGRFQVAVPGEATGLVRGAAVVGNYFGALGVRPAAGRLFGAAETELGVAEPVVVLSERARRRLFGGGMAVGRGITINGIPFTVVGVAADGFRGVTRGGDPDFWIPYGVYPRVRHADAAWYRERGKSTMHDAVARLADGATPAAAERQLRAAMARLVAAYPAENEHFIDYRPTVFTALGLRPWTVNHTRQTLLLLSAAVALVLLIACANVANLLIFRGVRRRGESAVRQAMGASRRRLLRQHLTESALLAVGGAVAGLVVTAGLARVFQGARLAGLPPLEALPVDWRVVAFATFAGAATVLLAGLVPAVVVHRVDLVRSLKDAAPTDTGRRRRLRAGLTVAQLALSLALLVGGLLLARTLRNLYGTELGFDAERVVTVQLDPEPQGYDEVAANRFQRELLLAAATVPGVDAVGAAAYGPLRANYVVDLRPAGAATDDWPIEAWGESVSPGYFVALGVRMLRGRTFSDDELEASWQRTSDAAVVNETLALRLFGTVDAVGRTLVERGYRENEVLQVVGVVADSRAHAFDGPQQPVLYRPLGEHYANDFALALRSTRPPASVIDGVRAALDRLDPALPFYWAGPVSRIVYEDTAEPRLLARLMSALAALAALLAGVGLYGVVAYSVAERTREIGIRTALGARGSEVVALVLRQALALAAAGVALGLGVAWSLGRLLENRLYGIGALDPVTWLAAAAALLLLALVAAVAPARAAVRIDPVRALKG